MKMIKKILYLIISMTYGIVSAHSFGNLNVIRRFGPNSYLTRIPLYFESTRPSHKASVGTAERTTKKKHKAMNTRSKK